jgi:hypothetical protein
MKHERQRLARQLPVRFVLLDLVAHQHLQLGFREVYLRWFLRSARPCKTMMKDVPKLRIVKRPVVMLIAVSSDEVIVDRAQGEILWN